MALVRMVLRLSVWEGFGEGGFGLGLVGRVPTSEEFNVVFGSCAETGVGGLFAWVAGHGVCWASSSTVGNKKRSTLTATG